MIIPTPRYIVFYNGSNVKMEEEQCVQRLSDSFMDASVGKDFEWTATMININYGKNKELMERCQKLKEYAILIAKIREYNRSMELIHAIDKAVEECIQENVSEIADAIETDTAFVQKVIELLEEHPGKDDIQLAELLLNMK